MNWASGRFQFNESDQTLEALPIGTYEHVGHYADGEHRMELPLAKEATWYNPFHRYIPPGKDYHKSVHRRLARLADDGTTPKDFVDFGNEFGLPRAIQPGLWPIDYKPPPRPQPHLRPGCYSAKTFRQEAGLLRDIMHLAYFLRHPPKTQKLRRELDGLLASASSAVVEALGGEKTMGACHWEAGLLRYKHHRGGRQKCAEFAFDALISAAFKDRYAITDYQSASANDDPSTYWDCRTLLSACVIMFHSDLTKSYGMRRCKERTCRAPFAFVDDRNEFCSPRCSARKRQRERRHGKGRRGTSGISTTRGS